jgi:hypothetical protein
MSGWLKTGCIAGLMAAGTVASPCMGQDLFPDREEFVKQGARLVTVDEYKRVALGNTLVIRLAASGTMVKVHFALSGEKLFSSGLKVKWWLREDGQFCEEVTATNRSQCFSDPDYWKLYVLGDQYKYYAKSGKLFGEYTIEKGKSF